jgi:magnesium chelatase subunit D
MSAVYPWSAVVGQDALKLALLLSAIDPAIGGVLLSGPRGVAKTTLARALAELVPGRFVELPLGASEERVAGTLDLDAALREGSVKFAPGLLAKAHEGVLYVDEVNLLPDALVDLLLDAASSGRNTIERDGISHTHPARFVLVGTMNPEEGELRPQLTDRFGLSVSAESEIQPAERTQIVQRRLAFDSDPDAFLAQFKQAQQALAERCRRARERAQSIALSEAALALVAQRCYEAGVEGVRADLAMLRAARAHAAWHEQLEISSTDIDAVAELALAHRRKNREPPTSPPRGTTSGSAPPGTPPTGGSARSPVSRAGAQQSSVRPDDTERSQPQRGEGKRSEGERGALAAVAITAAAPPKLPAWLFGAAAQQSEHRRRGRARLLGQRGQPTRGPHSEGAIDWFSTLAHTPKPRRADLRRRARRTPPRQLFILAVDCSSSMLRSGALATAKGVAHALEQHALRGGAHVALLSFRGASNSAELHLTRDKRSLRTDIAELTGGGGTPLKGALLHALALCEQRPWHARTVKKRLVLLTDGRTRERLDNLATTRPDLDLLVIDCERSAVRLGRAATLASTLHGRYLHVDSLA